MNVWLDDQIDTVRPTPQGWIGVKTAQDAIELLKTGRVERLSLDHDLGEESEVGTGYDVLEWIEQQVAQNGFNPPRMVVHSANPSARVKMVLGIQSINRLANRKA